MENLTYREIAERADGYALGLTGAYLALIGLLVEKSVFTRQEAAAMLAPLVEQMKDAESSWGAQWAEITIKHIQSYGEPSPTS